MKATLPSPEALIPHGPPMRILDHVRSCDASTLEGEATLRRDNPFAQGKRVATVATLELMAQAAAAWVGWCARARGESPRPGYLVNVRELRLDVDELAVGATLGVRVRAGDGGDGLRQFEGEVWLAGRAAPAARARFAVYQPTAASVRGDEA